jgi:excinuclease UvrABC ATPase subunit
MLRKHVSLDGTDEEDDEGEDERAESVSTYFEMSECPSCHGARLNEEARSVKVGGKTIHELCAMELTDLDEFLRKVPKSMDRIGKSVAESIVTRIRSRLARMIEIGIGYLSIDRPTATLSGGESQRVKMSRQLDCDLTGIVYILDEPSIGLHPSDVRNLVSIMRRLRDKGNTVIVIEHDGEIIRSADHVIDVGPGGGSLGGRIVFEGDVAHLERSDTLTGTHLARKGKLAPYRRTPKGYFELTDVRTNNLKDVSVRVPEGVLVCVTGVAGSGKSSLINGAFRARYPDAVVIDQSAISRSRRSTPASYTKVLDLIRKEFAKTTGADAGLFSFNSTGACPACNGLGEIEIEMHFLESVSVPCEQCKGKRFKDEVLELRMNGLNIADVLDSTIDDAIKFFEHPEIKRRLGILSDTGLGYLTLGQNLSSLSGGEAQRVKLGSELRKSGNVYIMDEPTTGLHMADIARLSRLIQRLVEAGNSVIVIEHNLEIIAEADWIIDLGPCGGSRGGRIVAEGTPDEICASKSSLTGSFLREYLSKDAARFAG